MSKAELRAELERLEAEMASEGFWDDEKRAASVSHRHTEVGRLFAAETALEDLQKARDCADTAVAKQHVELAKVHVFLDDLAMFVRGAMKEQALAPPGTDPELEDRGFVSVTLTYGMTRRLFDLKVTAGEGEASG